MPVVFSGARLRALDQRPGNPVRGTRHRHRPELPVHRPARPRRGPPVHQHRRAARRRARRRARRPVRRRRAEPSPAAAGRRSRRLRCRRRPGNSYGGCSTCAARARPDRPPGRGRDGGPAAEAGPPPPCRTPPPGQTPRIPQQGSGRRRHRAASPRRVAQAERRAGPVAAPGARWLAGRVAGRVRGGRRGRYEADSRGSGTSPRSGFPSRCSGRPGLSWRSGDGGLAAEPTSVIRGRASTRAALSSGTGGGDDHGHVQVRPTADYPAGTVQRARVRRGARLVQVRARVQRPDYPAGRRRARADRAGYGLATCRAASSSCSTATPASASPPSALTWPPASRTGAPMPDGSAGVKGTVLVLSAEDGLADTIRPRLDAADADPARVSPSPVTQPRRTGTEPGR